MNRNLLFNNEVMKKIIAILLIPLIFTWFGDGIIFSVEAVDNLNLNETKAIETMISGFENFADSIDLSEYDIAPERLGFLFSCATKNNPYLFYVGNNLSFSYERGGHVVSVTPKYNMTMQEASAKKEFCNQEIKRILSYVHEEFSQLERLIFVHNYICANYSYDTSLENDNMYDFLKNKTGTCQGYAWTYMAALRELGIDCSYIASDSINHIWILVEIGGKWYHSDVTWDDTVTLNGENEISYRHILMSDKKAADQGHHDWYSSVTTKCSDMYDDLDFQNVKLSQSFKGDADHNGELSLRDVLLTNIFINDKELCMDKVCLLCADLNENYMADIRDLNMIREKLISMDKIRS